MKIEAMKADDALKVRRLLSAAELVTEDLTPDKFDAFLVARDRNGAVVGAVGVEVFGNAGLLRSLVVDEAYRKKGLGRQLTVAVETESRNRGIRTLYLLTMTAAGFFPKLGYQPADRDEAPEAIRATVEFKSACPASAVCLSKQIG